MKLYVCYGTFRYSPRPGGRHPCGTAYHALRDANHDPEVQRGYGAGPLPDSIFNRSEARQEAKRLTGSSMLPLLVLDDGTPIQGSEKIVAWAGENPARAAAA